VGMRGRLDRSEQIRGLDIAGKMSREIGEDKRQHGRLDQELELK
jgi:hypothetical protein